MENNKKSSPTKTSQVHFVDDNKLCDNVTNRLYSVRHHLERTTGPGMVNPASAICCCLSVFFYRVFYLQFVLAGKPKDVEEGALLPSPTREKLMPTTPKQDESYSSQRGSPKKTTASRHGSPQKGSPQKSPKKVGKQLTKGMLRPMIYAQ